MVAQYILAHESTQRSGDVYALVNTRSGICAALGCGDLVEIPTEDPSRHANTGGSDAESGGDVDDVDPVLSGYVSTPIVKAGLHHLAANSEGTLVAVVSFDGGVYVYDLSTNELSEKIKIKNAWTCCFTSDDDLLVACLDGTVYLCRRTELSTPIAWFDDQSETSPCLAIDYANCGSRGALVVCAYANGRVKVFNYTSRRVAFSLPSRLTQPRAIKFSWTGETVAVAGESSVWLFSVKGGRFIGSLESENTVYDIAFSPGSDRLLTTDGDGFARVWDVQLLEQVFSTQVCKQPLFAGCFIKPTSRAINGAQQGFAVAGANETVVWYREAA